MKAAGKRLLLVCYLGMGLLLQNSWDRKSMFEVDKLITFPRGQRRNLQFLSDCHPGKFFNWSNTYWLDWSPQNTTSSTIWLKKLSGCALSGGSLQRGYLHAPPLLGLEHKCRKKTASFCLTTILWLGVSPSVIDQKKMRVAVGTLLYIPI